MSVDGWLAAFEGPSHVETYGNPWHGRFTSATNLRLTNGTDLTIPAQSQNSDTWYVNGGLPAPPAPAANLAAQGGQWFADAVLFGANKRWHPKSAIEVGADKWIYFDGNKKAWLLKATLTNYTWNWNGLTGPSARCAPAVRLIVTLVGRFGLLDTTPLTPCNIELFNQVFTAPSIAPGDYDDFHFRIQADLADSWTTPLYSRDLHASPNGAKAFVHACANCTKTGAVYEISPWWSVSQPLYVFEVTVSGNGSDEAATHGQGIAATAIKRWDQTNIFSFTNNSAIADRTHLVRAMYKPDGSECLWSYRSTLNNPGGSPKDGWFRLQRDGAVLDQVTWSWATGDGQYLGYGPFPVFRAPIGAPATNTACGIAAISNNVFALVQPWGTYTTAVYNGAGAGGGFPADAQYEVRAYHGPSGASVAHSAFTFDRASWNPRTTELVVDAYAGFV